MHLVLFLNGLPIATVELKTDFTQSIQDAIDQFRLDRNPSPKGQNPEPLLSFPIGALVHFAVTDPNIVLDLRSKIDSTGFYDEFEVNRVVDLSSVMLTHHNLKNQGKQQLKLPGSCRSHLMTPFTNSKAMKTTSCFMVEAFRWSEVALRVPSQF